jgi:uncharacterized protein (DUF1330 family)
MSSHIVAEIDWSEPGKIEEYSQIAYPTVIAAGGRFIAGGTAEVLEGDWKPRLVVVIEFPSTEAAKKWHESPEYRPARMIRQKYARTNMILL